MWQTGHLLGPVGVHATPSTPCPVSSCPRSLLSATDPRLFRGFWPQPRLESDLPGILPMTQRGCWSQERGPWPPAGLSLWPFPVIAARPAPPIIKCSRAIRGSLCLRETVDSSLWCPRPLQVGGSFATARYSVPQHIPGCLLLVPSAWEPSATLHPHSLKSLHALRPRQTPHPTPDSRVVQPRLPGLAPSRGLLPEYKPTLSLGNLAFPLHSHGELLQGGVTTHTGSSGHRQWAGECWQPKDSGTC